MDRKRHNKISNFSIGFLIYKNRSVFLLERVFIGLYKNVRVNFLGPDIPSRAAMQHIA